MRKDGLSRSGSVELTCSELIPLLHSQLQVSVRARRWCLSSTAAEVLRQRKSCIQLDLGRVEWETSHIQYLREYYKETIALHAGMFQTVA